MYFSILQSYVTGFQDFNTKIYRVEYNDCGSYFVNLACLRFQQLLIVMLCKKKLAWTFRIYEYKRTELHKLRTNIQTYFFTVNLIVNRSNNGHKCVCTGNLSMGAPVLETKYRLALKRHFLKTTFSRTKVAECANFLETTMLWKIRGMVTLKNSQPSLKEFPLERKSVCENYTLMLTIYNTVYAGRIRLWDLDKKDPRSWFKFSCTFFR